MVTKHIEIVGTNARFHHQHSHFPHEVQPLLHVRGGIGSREGGVYESMHFPHPNASMARWLVWLVDGLVGGGGTRPVALALYCLLG